jgi:plastocyanin
MRKILILLAAVALFVVGCGGGSSSSTPAKLSGSTTNKGTKDLTGSAAEVEMDDFYFNPTFIKTTPGQKITLTLKNEGKANHTFTSPDLSVDKELAPGSTVTVDITVPSADAAAFYCRFHQASGMQGAVFTKEGSSAGSGSGTTATTTAPSNGY